MTPTNPRLSLLTFPQRYDGTRLHLRILIVPRLDGTWSGSPLEPLIAGFPAAGDATPAFADADLQFEARVLSGTAAFPSSRTATFVGPLPDASGVVATSRPLFESLVAPLPGRFKLTSNPPELAGNADDRYAISKYLPLSYRDAFVFNGPRTRGALTDDSYHCAMKAKTPPNPVFKASPDTVSWGQVYAYCLRQPRLATRLGLVRAASVDVDPSLFEKGGYVYVALAAGSAYEAQVASQFTFISHYAARVPALVSGTARQLFAAVQFPVLYDDPAIPGPPAAVGTYDHIFIEAADYDDGFAKIVHGTQPVSQNLLAEAADGIAPVHDIGIRLGWDDEQILAWQNRQMTPDPSIPPVAGVAQRIDAPMGVFGYRIDARPSGADAWQSLVRVRPRAPIVLDDTRIDIIEDTEPGMELAVEVHPLQLDGNQATGRWWLPAYLSQWTGHSLVLPDSDAATLYHTEEAGAALGRQYEPIGLDAIPLRYGHSYQLRVRLMDPTGGGPEEGDVPIHESASPIATVPFRRHVVPEPVRLVDTPVFPPPVPSGPTDPDSPHFIGDVLQIDRPRLGYPSVVFTGKYADPIPLLQAASDRSIDPAPASRERFAFGIPDPDVQLLRFDVDVRALKMDNKLSATGADAWARLYSTTRALPGDLDVQRSVPLSFRDANVIRFGDVTDLGDFGLTAAEIDAIADELPLPTARDIRITIRAEAVEDPAYWAPDAHVGKPTQITVRRESRDERRLIAADSDANRIRALWLRPDPAPLPPKNVSQLFFQRMSADETPGVMERLAQNLELAFKGMTLVGKPGERVAFACSRRIRHTLSPDSSSLTLAAKEDLGNHWIVGVTLRLDRDWMWESLRHIGFHIFREGSADPAGRTQVGEWEIIQTASFQALHGAQRSFTRLVFLDAVDPQTAPPRPGQPADAHFPDTIDLRYNIETRFSSTPAQADEPLSLSVRLPVTTAPAQVPRIVAAGLALSEYRRTPLYSSSEPRRRVLWLELDREPDDPNDAYFIRLLAYTPDPLLSDNRIETFIPPEEAPLALDPELVRVITPGESDDSAGLSAMQPLLPGESPRHFMVPIPPGLTPDGAEMFGMFTYELRVGHLGIWSTAQARFGRALRSTGVQHPAPTLLCTTMRDRDTIIVEAPYAQAALAGRNITASPPRTQIWALLYAQVRQADDKDSRNILLEDRMLVPRRRLRDETTYRAFGGVAAYAAAGFENADAAIHGIATWDAKDVRSLLAAYGLPDDSSLSVLCVEMMPTLEALVASDTGGGHGYGASELAARAYAARAGTGASVAGSASVDAATRPLTSGLGNYRILRTSPLTAIPDSCCADC